MLTLQNRENVSLGIPTNLISELKAFTTLVHGSEAIENEIIANLDEKSQKRMSKVMRTVLKDELSFVLEIEMLRNKQNAF